MRFVAPCGHKGTPVTPNYITCEVCDKVSKKAVAATPPPLTWKTLRQYQDELVKAYSVFVGTTAMLPGSAFYQIAVVEAQKLFELQELALSLSPESFS